MGKSKGNVITIANIKKKYSADVYRFYTAHSADFSAIMDFREKEIEMVKIHVCKFFDFIFDKITHSSNSIGNFKSIKDNYSKVILSKIVRKFIEAINALNEFNIRKSLQISFYELFNLVQEFFRDIDQKNNFYTVFKIIYLDWLRILSLTMPHLCEELWEVAGNKDFISTEVWGDFNKKYINNDLETEFEYISSVVDDIMSIKKIVKSQNSENVHIYLAPEWKYNTLDIIISKGDEFKEIISELRKDKKLIANKQLIPYIKEQLKARVWEKDLPKISKEFELLNQYKSYIEKKVNNPIVIDSDYDPKKRAIRAKPFKPALYIDT